MSETITWIDAETQKPDADLLVLIARYGKDVSIGSFDDGDGGDQWRCEHGAVVKDVTHWAELPLGPI